MIYNTYNFNSDFFKIYGRTVVNDNGGLIISWPSSGFEFNFYGTGVIFSFENFKFDEPAYVRVFVDGKSARYALASNREKIILEYLEEGPHTVKFLKVTESNMTITVSEIMLTGTTPELLKKPADKELKIEFIGDSITCGYGVCAPGGACGFNTFEEDSTKSYAYMTAQRLNADMRMVGASGKGIVANCSGNRSDLTLVNAFESVDRNADKDWDYSVWTPDVVVVNAGTNDAWGGITDEEFIPIAVNFLNMIRKAYENARILWVYGVMDVSKSGAIEDAINQFSETDGKAHFLKVQSMSEFDNEVGGGGHPNTVTSVRVSKLLADEITRIIK